MNLGFITHRLLSQLYKGTVQISVSCYGYYNLIHSTHKRNTLVLLWFLFDLQFLFIKLDSRPYLLHPTFVSGKTSRAAPQPPGGRVAFPIGSELLGLLADFLYYLFGTCSFSHLLRVVRVIVPV